MKGSLLIAVMLLALGAGCVSKRAGLPEDATPAINERNCTISGGVVVEDFCSCPEGYDIDPAGFCLDAQGRPGSASATDAVLR